MQVNHTDDIDNITWWTTPPRLWWGATLQMFYYLCGRSSYRNQPFSVAYHGVWYQNPYCRRSWDWGIAWLTFRAALASTADKTSFAYISARDRWPVILVRSPTWIHKSALMATDGRDWWCTQSCLRGDRRCEEGRGKENRRAACEIEVRASTRPQINVSFPRSLLGLYW